MKLPKRLLAVAGVATGAAIPLAFAATAANAATPGAVKVVTHLSNRADTCTCATNVPSPGGNVWAYDNISRQFTITNIAKGEYTVTVTDKGSFSAFAQPNNTDPTTVFSINATGSLTGSETWDVTGVTGVDANGLSAQTPADVSTPQMINELLPGANENANLLTYSFSYRSGNGSTYTQVQAPAPALLQVNGNITG
jgi:hypothetical protein